MWLTDLLRKITKGPDVGETFRNYIGCYLYGTVDPRTHVTEYIGAPTSMAQLQVEVARFLQDFVDTQTDAHAPAVQQVQALLHDLPARLQAHVGTDMTQPFIALDGVEMFIRKGVRQRSENESSAAS